MAESIKWATEIVNLAESGKKNHCWNSILETESLKVKAKPLIKTANTVPSLRGVKIKL